MKSPKVVLKQVGADVESFLMAGTSPVSAVGRFGGTKTAPKPIIGMEKGFFIQEDNVMPEYNIPPANDALEFASNIHYINRWLKGAAKQMGFTVSFQASANLNPSYLKTPQAQTFGCEPDYCVWTKTENQKPQSTDPTLRTAGGHLHMSYLIDGVLGQASPKYIEIMEELVKLNDLYLGIPSLFLDKDTKRRELYGKAGAFRPKSYGHEYRVLSPFWAKDVSHSEWAFHQCRRAVDSYNEGFRVPDSIGKAVQAAINKNNIAIARVLTQKYKLEFPI